MKKLLSLLGLLCLAVNGIAQTSTENYVFSTTCLTVDCVKKTETIQYSDGLGRPKQILNVGVSPSGKDVVTHIEYDAFGRQVTDYLPVPQSGASTRNIYPKASATDASIYGGEKIFAEKVIENSPLNRVQQQIQPGTDWQTYPVTHEYLANDINDVLKFNVVTGTQNGANYAQSLNINGYYPANKVYKNKMTDEDGNITYEFKNTQGQTLMIRKRVQATSDPQSLVGGPPQLTFLDVDTYYVYNEYNQLAFVITPIASEELRNNSTQTITDPSDNTIIKELCYQYRYDSRERLVEKKLPGKGWEYFVYDLQDRLIMTQDANLGTSGQWTFTKFDQYSRPAYGGLCSPGNGNRTSDNLLPDSYRQTQQTAANAVGNNNVFRTPGFNNNLSGIKILYTSGNTYPADNTIQQMLSLNYYDKYPTLDDNDVAGGTALPVRQNDYLGQKSLSDDAEHNKISTQGLPVASYVNIIDQQQWTKTFLWYDELGRQIGLHTINHLGGSTVSYSLLDFTGAPQKNETWHKRIDSETPIHIVENFEYDDHKRILKHYHEVVGRTPKELLSENHYNEKNQLDWKKVGSESDGNFAVVSPAIQQMVYDYNIRSWVTGINLDQNDIARPLDPAKLFTYKIRYNDSENSAIKNYNGNISEIEWLSDSGEHNRYDYSYDALNRLLKADYKTVKTTGTQDSKFYNEELTYDLNGNIQTLQRNARPQVNTQAAVQVDNLKYYYDNDSLSNKLWKITDNEGGTGNTSGYPGGGGTITYDYNGNMLTMPDKGIMDDIVYNYLNLPQQVLQNGNTVNYTYRADGVKVHKQYVVNDESIDTDYLDGFVYTTPYSAGLQGVLQDNPQAALAGQPEAFELAEKVVVVDPGHPQHPVSNPNFFPTAEGFYDYENSRYVYQYKDYLGNVRLSFTKNPDDGSAEVVSSNDYYPFGLNFINIQARTSHPPVYNPSVSFENFKYNGKELEETGMYDYGARFYMPDVGRFGMFDPLAEKTFEPYAYVYNNPLRMIDPTGMEGEAAAPPPDTGSDNAYQSVDILGGIKINAGTAAVSVAFSASSSPVNNTSDSANKTSSGPNANIHNKAVDFLNVGLKDPTPLMAGIFAHRALAGFIKTLGSDWHPEELLLHWNWDLKMRPDVYYMKNGINAVWELKPSSQNGDSYTSFKGRSQAQGYADFLTFLKGSKFHTGSSNGAPVPITNGQILSDVSGYKFSYYIPKGSDGMIYYDCLNCISPEPDAIRETHSVPRPIVTPQQINQMGATAVGLLILRAAILFVPN